MTTMYQNEEMDVEKIDLDDDLEQEEDFDLSDIKIKNRQKSNRLKCPKFRSYYTGD